VDTLDDSMRVNGHRTIQGRSQQVPKIFAAKVRRGSRFAGEETAWPIEARRAARWRATPAA
jgi:hypothetical protein